MANVTKPGIDRGAGTGTADDALTPAEKEKLLVRRAQGGDVGAYEDLLRTHQRRLLAVIGGILRGSEDVEDVAQQALAKAYFSIRSFDSRSAFGTWLYKIAVNECWDYLRKKKVRRLVYEADLSEDQLRKLDAIPSTVLAASDIAKIPAAGWSIVNCWSVYWENWTIKTR
jgi:DNA-directed RNA polymerase specialized sigma24 family protein